MQAAAPGIAPAYPFDHIHCVIPSIRGEGFHYICIIPDTHPDNGWESWNIRQISVKAVDNQDVRVYNENCFGRHEVTPADVLYTHDGIYNAAGHWNVTWCEPLPAGVTTMKDALMAVFEGDIAIKPEEGLSLAEWMQDNQFLGAVQTNKYGAPAELGRALD